MTQFPIPILTYHSIDDSGSVISTSPEVFRRQMECLHALNCKVISLKEFARVINEGAGLPRRTVVLTFDDGFRNFAAEAFPVLRRYGFQATVFLVTDTAGATITGRLNRRVLRECRCFLGRRSRSCIVRASNLAPTRPHILTWR